MSGDDIVQQKEIHCRGVVRRGLADSATNQLARKLPTGLHEAWSAVRREVDVDSTRWLTFIERKGPTKEAS